MAAVDNTNRISYEEAHILLSYDPATGVFRWKTGSPWKLNGSVAGYYDGTYKYIAINGRIYSQHRLAWFMVYGTWPARHIDHIDNNKYNNRIENLRDVTQAENNKNIRMTRSNTSGVLGVTWFKRDCKWQSQIQSDGRYSYLGLHDDFKLAVLARWQAEVKHGFPNCISTSSAYTWLQENAPELLKT